LNCYTDELTIEKGQSLNVIPKNNDQKFIILILNLKCLWWIFHF